MTDQVERYDYDNQAWTKGWVYMRCGHPESMNCGCYGRKHAGEFATEFKLKTLDRCNEIQRG